MVENTRFYPGEEKNDLALAEGFAALGDLYVNDAFGSAHRAHASTEAVARILKPAVSGFLMERELKYLGEALDHPKRPFVAVLGGAKISGKIDLIEALLPKVDEIVIGGAMACTFFKAMGLETGNSLVEAERVDLAKDLIRKAGRKLVLPSGAVLAQKLEPGVTTRTVRRDQITAGWAMFDIDPLTEEDFAAVIEPAGTVIWNGPMGVFETPPFDHGTLAVAHALARATGTRLYVVRPDRTALADSAGEARIGEWMPALERVRFEIARAAAGHAVASQVMFQGSDGKLYKTGYAPLSDSSGKVVAVVGADGTAASFQTLRRFRRIIATVAVAGAVLGALVAAGASLSVTRPLTRLAEAARRISRGDLRTPLAPRRSKDELGMLRDTLEEMRRALHARDEERETLLAGIAHEVRNPLGALDLFAGLLAEELQGRPEEEAHVARIRSELAALSKVVEEFLDYARTRPPVREDVTLGPLLAEVVELSAPLATARQVALSSEGDGAVRADREQLRRALLNLVRNAVEAAPAGSAVELFARSGEAEVVIEVRDRGPGLGPEAREGLFRPFFTTKERGTGLGLALAKKVADAHGGALELLDREGGGTVARLAVVDAAWDDTLVPALRARHRHDVRAGAFD